MQTQPFLHFSLAVCVGVQCDPLPLPPPVILLSLPLTFPLTPQILENIIKFKWGALPEGQREGIKTFLSNLIIHYAADEVLFRKENSFVNKVRWQGFRAEVLSPKGPNFMSADQTLVGYNSPLAWPLVFSSVHVKEVCWTVINVPCQHAVQLFTEC